MRLNFRLSKNTEIIPFDYQYKLLGKLHSWLGKNNLHDKISLYSFGSLSGLSKANGGLHFPRGANWFVSFWDGDFGKKIIPELMSNPDFIYGMQIEEITIQHDPNFGKEFKFLASSPILVRDYKDKGKAVFLTTKDEKADELMTRTLQRKLKSVDLDDDISVEFYKNYHNPKTKLIDINGIKNRANMCPVLIKGNPESLQFAWNVGVGHSTGAGFGALI